MIGAVILAAGKSERLGRPKQLLPYRGKTLVRNAVDCAVEAGCDPVLVVLGANVDVVRAELESVEVETVFNKRWKDGIAGSIRRGVQALQQQSPDVDAVILVASDQPLIRPEVLRKLIKKFDGSSGRMVSCHYADTIGIPAVFEKSLFPELLELDGDAGAKSILERHRPNLLRVAWPEGVVDIDTPADYCDLIEKNYVIPDRQEDKSEPGKPGSGKRSGRKRRRRSGGRSRPENQDDQGKTQ